ncbi:MAG: ArsI/CadI family heavy metal resistance metalloenzyme [Pseudomonadota bacterium]
MKRLHVHLDVEDLQTSIGFYSTLFAADPEVIEKDYASWMLDDPRINFAVSTRASRQGVSHLGIQVDDETELEEVYQRLDSANGAILDEGTTTCCYARSTKRWITDPQGVAWETFLTHGRTAVYGHERHELDQSQPESTRCC